MFGEPLEAVGMEGGCAQARWVTLSSAWRAPLLFPTFCQKKGKGVKKANLELWETPGCPTLGWSPSRALSPPRRSRSVVRINASLRFEPSKINIFTKDCRRNGKEATCMRAFVCFTALFLSTHFQAASVGKDNSPIPASLRSPAPWKTQLLGWRPPRSLGELRCPFATLVSLTFVPVLAESPGSGGGSAQETPPG